MAEAADVSTNEPDTAKMELTGKEARLLSVEDRMALAIEGPTLIFDGICNLCNGSMSWFQARCQKDSPVWYMWAQHEDTHALLAEVGITRHDILRSWAYLEDGVVYRGSTAWLKALRNLEAPWCFLSYMDSVPPIIRETVYNTVATNRYSALGASDACQRPNQAMKDRFLHSPVVKGEHTKQIPPKQKRRLLVIGCDVAGLEVATRMAKYSGDFDVLVVEPKEYYESPQGTIDGICDLQSLNTNMFKLEPLLCNDIGISFVQGKVTSLDSHHAILKRERDSVLRNVSGRSDFFLASEDNNQDTVNVEFDFCVVSTGTDRPLAITRVEQTNVGRYPLRSRLADSVSEITGNGVTDESASFLPPPTHKQRKEELTREYNKLNGLNSSESGRVTIRGANLVGVELGASIKQSFPGIPQVSLLDPNATVLSTHSTSVQEYVTSWLENQGVELFLGDQYSADFVKESNQHSNVVYKCDGVLPTKPDFLPRMTLDSQGQVRVNAAMQIVVGDDSERNDEKVFGAGRVFAVGDGTSVVGDTMAMSKVVVANLLCAKTVQCMRTCPGVLCELTPSTGMMFVSLGLNDGIMSWNGKLVLSGKMANIINTVMTWTSTLWSKQSKTVMWFLIPVLVALLSFLIVKSM